MCAEPKIPQYISLLLMIHIYRMGQAIFYFPTSLYIDMPEATKGLWDSYVNFRAEIEREIGK